MKVTQENRSPKPTKALENPCLLKPKFSNRKKHQPSAAVTVMRFCDLLLLQLVFPRKKEFL
ncbi:hypothetical protein HK099_004894 [Clydaea vesicula]|uniref:Uncharacterized protein n=1 Tax=Clydaea vesicula TaxID=447962 RepID=A0AAD5XXX8_9FUNG|nr:hypothetical protein HK099_004894 [Clydaea vesicula]